MVSFFLNHGVLREGATPARFMVLPTSWRNALHDHGGPLRFQFKALKIPDTPVFPFCTVPTPGTLFLRQRRQHD